MRCSGIIFCGLRETCYFTGAIYLFFFFFFSKDALIENVSEGIYNVKDYYLK